MSAYRRALLGLGACLTAIPVLVASSVPLASAHDGNDTGVYGIWDRGDNFHPSWGGAEDEDYNGLKVFLSSPRHTNSGSRGECRNPGREENVNGRSAGWRAGNGDYIGETHEPSSPYRNIHGRGYLARVGRNVRDGNYLGNYNFSRNWGADIHIVTHTNAYLGCPSSASYLLTMYEHANDQSLATALGSKLDYSVPSGWNNWYRGNLKELESNATYGDAYIELQFHDNQQAQSWLYSETYTAAWRYGFAIDSYLGYP